MLERRQDGQSANYQGAVFRRSGDPLGVAAILSRWCRTENRALAQLRLAVLERVCQRLRAKLLVAPETTSLPLVPQSGESTQGSACTTGLSTVVVDVAVHSIE